MRHLFKMQFLNATVTNIGAEKKTRNFRKRKVSMATALVLKEKKQFRRETNDLREHLVYFLKYYPHCTRKVVIKINAVVNGSEKK